MSIQIVQLRKRMGNVPQSNVLLSFRITHVHQFALELTLAHIRAPLNL